MNTEYKGKWLYDIFLHGRCVGNQGDEAFDTKEEAEKIARETLEDTKIKDALIKYKNKLNMISKIKEKSDYER